MKTVEHSLNLKGRSPDKLISIYKKTIDFSSLGFVILYQSMVREKVMKNSLEKDDSDSVHGCFDCLVVNAYDSATLWES